MGSSVESTTYCNDPNLDETLTGFCEDIIAVQQEDITKKTNDEIRDRLDLAVHYMDQQAATSSDPGLKPEQNRSVAFEAYRSSLAELQIAAENARTGNADSFVLFDPTRFFVSYQEARFHHQFGCDVEALGETTKPTDLDYEKWLESKNGDDSCPVLGAMQSWIFDLEDNSAFVPPPKFHLFKWLSERTRVSPFAYYTAAESRSGVGAGVGLEFLSPIGDSRFALGTEARLLVYPVFDEPSIFSGELSTLEFGFVPPLLEAGYQGDKATVLFQGGVWFSNYDLLNPGSVETPYSDNVFENPNFQLGAKAYLFDNRFRVAAGYQHTPWGSAGYGELGYSFGGNKP